MSKTTQTSVFLPNYILQCIHEGSNPPRIDPEIFLSKASSSNILDLILAFYPHFNFDENTKQNHAFLRKIFHEMVAARLFNVVIPLDFKPQNYFQAFFKVPICGPQDSRTTIRCGDDVDPRRIAMFNSCALTYLRSGQYRLAAENLNQFIKDFKHLSKDEIYTIRSAQEEAEENLHSNVLLLKEAHQSIEEIHLQLCDSDISASRRQELEVQLKAATRVLDSRQKMLDRGIQDVGFLAAMTKFHSRKYELHTWMSPMDDPAEPDQESTPQTNPME